MLSKIKSIFVQFCMLKNVQIFTLLENNTQTYFSRIFIVSLCFRKLPNHSKPLLNPSFKIKKQSLNYKHQKYNVVLISSQIHYLQVQFEIMWQQMMIMEIYISYFKMEFDHQQHRLKQIQRALAIAQNLIAEITKLNPLPQQTVQLPPQVQIQQSALINQSLIIQQQSFNEQNPSDDLEEGRIHFSPHLSLNLEILNPNEPDEPPKNMNQVLERIQDQESSSNKIEKLCKSKVKSKWRNNEGQKKGKFSSEEEKILSQGVGEFLALHQISYENFISMISERQFSNSLLARLDFYKIMASLLPGRSTLSCYHYLKRNFQKQVKRGPWSIEEQRRLLRLVEQEGQKWTKIARQLDRFSADVSLKYRTMGSHNAKQRLKGTWTLSELSKLMNLVQQRSLIHFLDPNLGSQLAEEESHNMKDHLDHQSRINNSSKFQHHNNRLVLKYIRPTIKEISLEGIPWATIAGRMKTRSMIDCKNKFLQFLETIIKAYKIKHEGIISFIQRQKVTEEYQIDWLKWEGQDINHMEAKNRFLFLKKLIANKSRTPFLAQLQQLKQKLKQNGLY